jgi:hypothetical protein
MGLVFCPFILLVRTICFDTLDDCFCLFRWWSLEGFLWFVLNGMVVLDDRVWRFISGDVF